VAWAEVYFRTKWHLDPSSLLATTDMAKIGWGCARVSGGWVPIKRKVAWADAYLHTKWHLDASSRLATIEMGRNMRHSLVLAKLITRDIAPAILNWNIHFLTNRTQVTKGPYSTLSGCHPITQRYTMVRYWSNFMDHMESDLHPLSAMMF